jgi:hypothetical protein
MPDTCIECQSDNIVTTDSAFTEDDIATFHVKCNKCKAEWIEYYELSKIEKIEKLETL